ncbi:MAG TPA: arylsulfatase [Humisphaera sp.]
MLVALLALATQTRAALSPAPTAPRPNVVLIMADDMGFSDIGPFGGEISTPNLDKLAAGGIRLRQFYNGARCCPTRAALLTGLYAHQAGVGHMVDDKGDPAYQGYLNDKCATIAEVLGASGYQTLMSGKWHVGEKPGRWPADRGFEHSYSLISGASNYWKLDKGRTFAIDHQSTDPTTEPDFHLTDGFTRQAVKYITDAAPAAKAGKPFFLYLAYTAPHWPLHARPADIEKYRGKYMGGWDKLREARLKRQIELGVVPAGTKLTPRDEKAPAWDSLSQEQRVAFDLKMAVYAAQVEQMDRGIGQVMKALADGGVADNTLMLFMADNGGCAEAVDRGEVKDAPPGPKESFKSYGLPWANASNTPFRLYKHWVHEGGIASPFIAYWPGRVKANAWGDEPAHLIDVMPTLVELAGASYPKERGGKPITPMEGRSMVPVLTGAAAGPLPERPIFWEHEGHRAVRLGNWKLVAKGNGPFELYDMATDRIEENDLAAKQPAKLAEMKALYQAWAQRVGVKAPGSFKKKAGGEKAE